MKTGSHQEKSRAVSLWRRIKSWFGRTKKLHSPNRRPSENGEDNQLITKSSKSPDKEKSRLPPMFGQGRRAATCLVLEEKQLYDGISLSKLKEDLILYSLLNDAGLL